MSGDRAARSLRTFLSELKGGETRAIARAITILENEHPQAKLLRFELQRATKKRVRVIGVTGSPGAGKSSLVDQLAAEYGKRGKKVGVLAIDPSSPFSGGAVLGDRVRMARSEQNSKVFIRSMASRGALGGLARAVDDALLVLSAAQFSIVFLETVGVGQSEVEVAQTADSCVVVTVPGMGDTVQAFKAGVLEIADILVINKADRDGADMLARELKEMISLGEKRSWTAPIVRTVATEGQGVAELIEKIDDHGKWLLKTEEGQTRMHHTVERQIMRYAEDELRARMGAKSTLLAELAAACRKGSVTIAESAQMILAERD